MHRGVYGLLSLLLVLSSLTWLGCADGRPAGFRVMDVMAEDFEFTAPDSAASGWTTFRMHNQGSEAHLFTLLRLPDEVTYEEFQSLVVAPYDSVWSLFVEGTIDLPAVGERLEPLLPDWYPARTVQPGGVSLVSPGGTGRTTVKLTPGAHALFCYVLTPDGQFHALDGMVAPLTVYEAPSNRRPPEADLTLTVSNLRLEGVGPASTGRQTIAVRLERDPEGAGAGEGHQHLHLARLSEEATVSSLLEWMEEWIGENPIVPAPVEFLGGAQHMSEGNTAYVTVELDPGRYAWILAVPPEHGVVETFTVE